MRTNDWHVLLIVALIASVAPLTAVSPKPSIRADFPGWPTQFEGHPLQALPLTQVEQRFSSAFPGRIARFTDGRREIVMRWVTQPTRKLHPAMDCFRGAGYSVGPLPLDTRDGVLWSSFIATKADRTYRVSEALVAPNGERWTDVSSWYWSAVRNTSTGPWWAITVAEATQRTQDSGVSLLNVD